MFRVPSEDNQNSLVFDNCIRFFSIVRKTVGKLKKIILMHLLNEIFDQKNYKFVYIGIGTIILAEIIYKHMNQKKKNRKQNKKTFFFFQNSTFKVVRRGKME